MMVDILSQNEALPEAYPVLPFPIDRQPDEEYRKVIWGRIERYIAYRFAPRVVVWTVQGEAGASWSPPLGPVVSLTAERWFDVEYVAVDLVPGPMGYVLPSNGTYRLTAQVGAGPVPPSVIEAARRLAEYSIDIGSVSDGFTAANDGEASFQRQATWAGRAIQLSGAADLLRPYRRFQ